MKTYYRLTRNGTHLGDYDDLNEAFDRARTVEGSELDHWNSDDIDEVDQNYWCFGKTLNGLRTEYEVSTLKKR